MFDLRNRKDVDEHNDINYFLHKFPDKKKNENNQLRNPETMLAPL
jgi:hypothetical protein